MPLKASKAWALSVEELQAIAQEQGIALSAKSKLGIAKQLQAARPSLAIFDAPLVAESIADVEAKLETVLYRQQIQHHTLTEDQAAYLRANWLVPFRLSLLWPKLEGRVDWRDRRTMQLMLEMMREERALYSDAAQAAHLREELQRAQRDWDDMVAEGLVR